MREIKGKTQSETRQNKTIIIIKNKEAQGHECPLLEVGNSSAAEDRVSVVSKQGHYMFS